MYAISYRREDTGPIAGRIHDRLAAQFGASAIFMDIDSISYGADFRQKIANTFDSCSVLLVLMGPHWVGSISPSQRRIDNTADFVRLEVSLALKRGIPVIPVLIDRTEMFNPENLPDDLKDLAYRHALRVDSGVDFNHHMERLCAAIRNISLPLKGTIDSPSERELQSLPPLSLSIRQGIWRHIFTVKNTSQDTVQLASCDLLDRKGRKHSLIRGKLYIVPHGKLEIPYLFAGEERLVLHCTGFAQDLSVSFRELFASL